MIRELRNREQSPDEHLRELYRFATLYALVYPPSPDGPVSVLDDDGPTDAEVWTHVESLSLPYEDVGYERLELLNKTDVTWLVEAWGEPAAHLVPFVRPDEPKRPDTVTEAPATASEAGKPPEGDSGKRAQRPNTGASEEPEPEIYRPPAITRMEQALAPKPRHKYDGGLVPAPEDSDDPVYDLMDRIATQKDQEAEEARTAKLLKRAASLVGLGE